jgi:phosphoglycerol transferase MdoB-like AlkP superfamily enzyme
MKKKLNILQSYKALYLYLFLTILIGIGFRVVLLVLYAPSFNEDVLYSILYGIKMDIMSYSVVMLIVVWFYLFNLITISRYLLIIFLIAYLFLELMTITYFANFMTRPDYIIIDNLGEPIEMMSMAVKMYPIYVVISLLILFYLIKYSSNYFKRTLVKTSVKHKILLFPIMLFLLLFGMRQTFDRTPPNQSNYTFSNNSIYNQIANTTFYSLAYDIHLHNKNKMYDYGKLDEKSAIKNLQSYFGEGVVFKNDDTLERYVTSKNGDQKNIILVMVESAGSNLVGHLGGRDLTPNLDNIAQKGLTFSNMQAAGRLTRWGVASILSNLYPNPNGAYVTMPQSKRDFFTIATVLNELDYHNIFLYGGNAQFDNRRGFTLSNGFHEVYDRENFEDDDRFTSLASWGYHDQDLFTKAYDLIKEQKGNYLLTILTLSNHEPFDYPMGVIELEEGVEANTYINAMKYTDHAIGEFFDKLQREGLLKDTVIAFVADHHSLVWSSNGAPIDQYKILGTMYHDNMKPEVYNKLASQIDFVPTLLDVAGISYNSIFMGSSIYESQRESALVQYQKDYALLKPEYYIKYPFDGKAKIFDYQNNPLQYNKEQIDEGLSYIYGANYLYENGYRLKE